MYKIPMDRSIGTDMYIYLGIFYRKNEQNARKCSILYAINIMWFDNRNSSVQDINNMLWIGSFLTSDLSQNLKSIFWSKSRWLLQNQWDSFWESWCITTGQKGNPKHCPQGLLNQLIFIFLSVAFMAFVLLTSSNGECTGDKVAFETLERMVNEMLKHPPDDYPPVN